MEYINRKAEKEILDVLRAHLIAILTGPRQSGKTTLLRYLSDEFRSAGADVLIVDGDFPEQWETLYDVRGMEHRIEILPPNREVYLFVDELQKIRDGGTALKRMYDRFRHRIKFIATGSTFLWGRRGIGETLTGRALEINIFPLSLSEVVCHRLKVNVDVENFEKVYFGYRREINELWQHILDFGLFPNVFLSSPLEKEKAIRSIGMGFINRDIYSILPRGDWNFFRALMQVLATEAGILNLSRIARELKRDDKTVRTYIDMAEKLFILRLIQPFSSSLRVALRKAPRVLFSDCGLANSFARSYKIPDGILHEQAVGAEIGKAGMDIHFWRTKSGAEVDFVIGENHIPVEVKKGYRGYKITRGFRSFVRTYRPPIAFWLRPGKPETVRIDETDVHIMPAPMFVLAMQSGFYDELLGGRA